MSVPVRIQRKRSKGWRMPQSAIYVGRPTIWGNPFIHAERWVAVDAYRKLVSGGTQNFEMGPGRLQFACDCHPQTLHHAYGDFVRENVHALRGKDLACWCPHDQTCHADVLLELANAETVRMEEAP
jgi:hypothetical protein